MGKANALVLRTAGTNCDAETAYALSLAGAEPERVHVNRIAAKPKSLGDYSLLVIPGGFSYGDDIAAGRVLANELVRRLGDAVLQYVQRGRIVIGICNGFQVLVKAGLLPGFDHRSVGRQQVTLTGNDSGKFEDRWVTLASSSRRSIFAEGIERIDLPVAHGEGKFVTDTPETLERLIANDQVTFRYVSADGGEARYPANPNGSVYDIAGIEDASGRVLGMMPHPERFALAVQHPRWRREGAGGEGLGLRIFRNAVRAMKG
ncbi:MAG: phosphoribosylformylglycinamidine synthase I [Planctomycetota bacterium]